MVKNYQIVGRGNLPRRFGLVNKTPKICDNNENI